MAFEQNPLPYEFSALEPHIDATTMQIHYGKHHATYVSKLNEALAGHDDLLSMSIEELLKSIEKVPTDIKQKVIKNGGGHANHTFFWSIMSPNAGGEPDGALSEAINEAFGGLDKFKESFTNAALGRFGSGWAWLVLEGGKLTIIDLPNQDSPLMTSKTPIIGVDVWEHAYYLKYQNRRNEYLENWWNVVNWKKADEIFVASQG